MQIFIFMAYRCLAFAALAFAADSTFDDSYAQKVCGGPAAPADEILRALCVEMMQVGKWYSSELVNLGAKEPEVEVQIQPTHPQYSDVRKLGVDVDLRAQELMVLMARQRISSGFGSETTDDERIVKDLDATLAEMRQNAKSMHLVDALTGGIPPNDNNGAPARKTAASSGNNDGKDQGSSQSDSAATAESDNLLPALDPRALVAEALDKGIPLSELIIEKRSHQANKARRISKTGEGKREKAARKKQKNISADPNKHATDKKSGLETEGEL